MLYFCGGIWTGSSLSYYWVYTALVVNTEINLQFKFCPTSRSQSLIHFSWLFWGLVEIFLYLSCWQRASRLYDKLNHIFKPNKSSGFNEEQEILLRFRSNVNMFGKVVIIWKPMKKATNCIIRFYLFKTSNENSTQQYLSH